MNPKKKKMDVSYVHKSYDFVVLVHWLILHRIYYNCIPVTDSTLIFTSHCIILRL